MKSGQILIVPAVEKGRGGGHLSRCINLVKDLRSAGREAFLYVNKNTQINRIESLLNSMNFNKNWLFYYEKSLETYDLIILDRFQTSKDEIIFWKNLAPVIGIDEGGSYRDSFDFLIDILAPLNFIKPSANITSPALQMNTVPLQSQPQDQNKSESLPLKKILITFGQEDPAGLGIKTARVLSSFNNKNNIDITLLIGALSQHDKQINIDDINILEAIPNLASRLHEYDLVITHYGITAYEALFSGTPVLLDHPTTYHKKIAKAAGFYSFTKNNFFRILNKTRKNNKKNYSFFMRLRAPSFSEESHQSLAELANTFEPAVNIRCPVCGNEKIYNSISRFKDRTYRKCKNCGIIYMNRINPPPIEYAQDYFFDLYVKQYGKTYLEDFESIKKSGKKRIKTIRYLNNKHRISLKNAQRRVDDHKINDSSDNLSLLDIGCAYGPFLAAAKEEGCFCLGIDPAEDAVRYVNETLGINAIHSFFPVPYSGLLPPCSSPLIHNSFNVITLWYVIEHFKDCFSVFNEIKKYLVKGGILAFSTPSFSGVSGRTSIKKFLYASPADHYTVWSPSMCRKALSLAGFKVRKIVIAGHHPERFPVLGKLAKNKKGFVYKALFAISKIFSLGDTFEVYAQKK